MHLLKHIAEHHYNDDCESKKTYAEGHPENNVILYDFETKQKECHVFRIRRGVALFSKN